MTNSHRPRRPLAFSSPVRSVLAAAVLSAAVLSPAAVRAQAPRAEAQPAAQTDEQGERERAFTELLTDAALVGKFTVTGRELAPQEEEYRIGRIRKLDRDSDWLVEAEFEYAGKPPARIPITVQVEWAGDTPMIQVTDLLIPTMGRFTARVGFYDDLYFGMWWGGDHGGHMFGRVEKRGDATANAVGSAAIESSGGSSADGNWATWRGPLGTGEAPGATPPVEWSDEQNVRWKVQLPGVGQSTPIVWGDRMFLTLAVATEREGEPTGEALRGRRGQPDTPPLTNVHEFRILAVNRHTGEIEWNVKVAEEVPHEILHPTASQAANSAVTDGEHLFAHFGSRGIHALTLDGEIVWSKDLGRMRTRNQFGEGSSPALWGDTLVINWDHEGDDFIVALDKNTGEEKWRRERDQPTTWSTPLVVDVGGKPQVVVSATEDTIAYDLETGETVWSLGGLSMNVIPSPVPVGDSRVLVMSNFRGNRVQAIETVGAEGDLAGSDHVLWEDGSGNSSYVPSALVADGIMYMLRQNAGVLTALRVETGEEVYAGERVRGCRTVYSSPIAADGRIYIASREGTIAVVKAGEKFEILARNELDDVFNASPIAIGKDLYLRGDHYLWCLRAAD